MNLNFTLTPSQAGRNAETGEKIVLANGDDAPFNGTAETQVNLVLFYQNDKFQARVAGNYLSKQYVNQFSHWSFTSPNAGLPRWYDEQLFVDASVSYDVNDNFQVFVQGSNLTEEKTVQYVQWQDARVDWNQFERVVVAGVKAKF
jgi:outer membrane receptor protein involved in Fe transport